MYYRRCSWAIGGGSECWSKRTGSLESTSLKPVITLLRFASLWFSWWTYRRTAS